MDSDIQLYSKISWEIDNTKSWQESFYPSEVDRISRSLEHYSSHFEISFEELDNRTYLEEFLPLYIQEIASRSNYTLDIEEQKNLVLQRIKNRSPKIMIGKVVEKSTHQLAGGILFSLWEDRISVMHRVFDRAINKKYKKTTTIDFWFETQFRNFTITLPQLILTHGNDTHPYIQRIGIAEFKMRIGAKPYMPRNKCELITPDFNSILKTNTVVLYFDNLEGRGYKKATVLYTSKCDTSIINSCKAVLDWAQISTEYRVLE